MIKATRRPRCYACLSLDVTREVLCDGKRRPWCDRCPTPRELIARRDAIRDNWSPAEEHARRLGLAPGNATDTRQSGARRVHRGHKLPDDVRDRILSLARERDSDGRWRHTLQAIAQRTDVCLVTVWGIAQGDGIRRRA